MNTPQGSKFLSRTNYRQRRMIDAVKLLPVLGVGLFFLPLMLFHSHQEAEDGHYAASLSDVALYIFCVWVFLIILTFAFGIKLKDIESNTTQSDKSNHSDDSDI